MLARVQFGKVGNAHREDLEGLIHDYLASMYHAGQAYGEYYICCIRGTLSAYVPLSGVDAAEKQYHSPWGVKSLRKIEKNFGRTPVWQTLSDQGKNPTNIWIGSPFLYLFTNAFALESPVRRGDDSSPIPTHLLPLTFQEQDSLYGWRASYREHDSVWLDSGALEKAAYTQLSTPKSELSLEGRSLCRVIEKATGVRTFYYLMHYQLEDKKPNRTRCPACGKAWTASEPTNSPRAFREFEFKCMRCRLVSNR